MDGIERMSSDEGRGDFEKISRFKASLKNATQLFKSASEVFNYCFKKQSSFKEALEGAWRWSAQSERARGRVQQLIADLSQMLFEAARDSVVAFAKENNVDVELEAPDKWPIYARCEGSNLAKVTLDSIVLFYALYETRSIRELYSSEELDEMEQILRAASKLVCFVDSKDSKSFGEKLPLNVLLALDEQLYTKKMSEKSSGTLQIEEILSGGLSFIEENEVTAKEQASSSTRTTPPQENEVNEEREFRNGCENLIERIKSKEFDIDEMNRLSNLRVSGFIGDGEQLLETFCRWLPSVQNIFDIRVINVYLKLFKKIMIKCKEIDNCVKCVYRVWNDLMKDIPSLHDKYSNYNNEFTGLMNGLGDHTQFQNDEEKLDKVVREFAFLFAIDAKKTIWLTLEECVNKRLIVPNVLKIIRRLPSVLDLKLELNRVERGGCAQQIPLITLALRELVLTRCAWLENAEIRSSFVYLIQSLVRERYAQLKPNRQKESKQNDDADNEEEKHLRADEGADKSPQTSKKLGELVDCAVLNSSEVLMDLVLPWLFASGGTEIALDLLARILSDYETKRTPIEWNIEIREDDPVRANLYERFPVALCIKLLVDIVCHSNEDGDTTTTKWDKNEHNALVVESLALKCLAALGEKLKGEGVRFGEKTRDFLMGVLNARDWTVKYVVLSWFDECFEKAKREIPEALFKSISDERQQNFESIVVNFDCAPVECFFRSIFALGTLSPQLANQFLDDGISVKPMDSELNVKIAMAFIESIRVGTPNDRLLTTCDVLDKVLNVLDPSLESNPTAAFLNQSTVYGLRLVAPLKVLGDAVILAQRDVKKDANRRNQDISIRLLSVWCQRAKSHIEREMIDLRRSRLRYVPNIRDPLPIADDVTIDRLLRVKTELAELFSIAVMISKCVEEMTPQLQILLKTLAQFDAEVIQMGTGPILDIVQLDSKDDGAVYAFVKTSVDPSASPQTRTQFRPGAGGGDNENAETNNAIKHNSDAGIEDRQGADRHYNNNYQDNHPQNDEHQYTSASNTLFDMNSETDRSWRHQDVRLQQQYENEGRVPHRNRYPASTSSNRHDSTWGNRPLRYDSGQYRDKYGSGRQKEYGRYNQRERYASTEEEQYDDSRINRSGRNRRSEDYDALNQNHMIARGRVSGRDRLRSSGSRRGSNISSRDRRVRSRKRFDSPEVKTRNSEDEWGQNTEKAETHSPTTLVADSEAERRASENSWTMGSGEAEQVSDEWRAHETVPTEYGDDGDNKERRDSDKTWRKRHEDSVSMQESQYEPQQSERYQEQINEWEQLKSDEQQVTEAGNIQAIDHNSSVHSNDDNPQEYGEFPPLSHETAFVSNKNERMTKAYSGDGSHKKQKLDRKKASDRGDSARVKKGRNKMLSEQNGLNATGINNANADWKQQTEVNNRHRNSDDEYELKGQQKNFDRGDGDAEKLAGKAMFHERGRHRLEHATTSNARRLAREVVGITLQSDCLNLTDNDREISNGNYSEAQSTVRNNDGWNLDKGGTDENDSWNTQSENQPTNWNVESKHENDNCMPQNEKQIDNWHPQNQFETSTFNNQQQSTAATNDEMSSKTTLNRTWQESDRRINGEDNRKQSFKASELESIDRVDEDRNEKCEQQKIISEYALKEVNVDEASSSNSALQKRSTYNGKGMREEQSRTRRAYSDESNSDSNHNRMNNLDATAQIPPAATEIPTIQRHETNLLHGTGGLNWIFNNSSNGVAPFIPQNAPTGPIHGYVAENPIYFKPPRNLLPVVMGTGDTPRFSAASLPDITRPPPPIYLPTPSIRHNVRGRGSHHQPAVLNDRRSFNNKEKPAKSDRESHL